MSQVNPVPVVPAKTDWNKIFNTIVLIIAAMLGGSAIKPGPVTPTVIVTPTPNVVTPPVDPVKPVVNPPTPIDPQPVPIPANNVTITDVATNQVIGTKVEAGRMFMVTVADGVNIAGAIQPDPSAGDLIEASSSKLYCVLRNLDASGKPLAVSGKLQVIAYGAGKPTSITVECNLAPQPPPIINPTVIPVNPVNPTPVNPTPIPDVKSGVRVLTLIDDKGNMSRDQINALESPKVTAILNSKCVKSSSGHPEWHKWDQKADVSAVSADWQKLFNASKDSIASQSLKLPVMAIENGSKLTLYEITTEAALLGVLNSTFGS